MAPPPAMTSSEAIEPAAAGARTATSLAFPRIEGRSTTRAMRSASAKSTFGAESFRAYSISSVTHQAFMPTAATPRQTQAQ